MYEYDCVTVLVMKSDRRATTTVERENNRGVHCQRRSAWRLYVYFISGMSSGVVVAGGVFGGVRMSVRFANEFGMLLVEFCQARQLTTKLLQF